MSQHAARTGLPVIAIGASAGGLQACRALLKDMPADLPAAFILVLHLDPTHDSMMVELLARHTALKVVQASDGLALRSGYLHVIPPGVFLTVEQRVIHLTDPKGGKGVRLPYDVLLRSLAEDATVSSVGIVLSGTGTDGSLGIADIHAANGWVIAQDPKEADYPGMPESAIATGFVDQVLPIDQMVGALENFLDGESFSSAATSNKMKSTDATVTNEDNPTSADYSADYDEILSFVGKHGTQDTSLYKRGTLERRIASRMAMVGLNPDQVARYLDILQSDAEECKRLSSDLLIHVTSFFRDPAVFEYLSDKAIPDLLAAMPADRPLRVWAAGCSTGEEAYSLAISCIEAMSTSGAAVRLQVLASDLDPAAIVTARSGFYSNDIETCVSPERLARFFVREENGWRVASVLRDVIVFTVADILSDPPFSKIDLVSCRNLLIYLAPEAQKRVIERCCFALRLGGFLLLGAAEMPGQNDSCFAVEDKLSRLWRRVGKSHPGDLNFAIGQREGSPSSLAQTPVQRSALADLCRRIVLENYAPAAVLLNNRLEWLYLLGPTEKYLKVTQGHPDTGIVSMLPKALHTRFRAAAASCGPSNPRVTVTGGRINDSNRFEIVLHSVPAGKEHLVLACFVNTPLLVWEHAADESASAKARRTGDLEADLEATRSDLLEALRELEIEVESHSADAAEALSINEEFQSTNEELLASKEELQSLNEELTALNSQLQETLERQRTTANDLQNVLYSTDVATLFLDLDLNIEFFTPAVKAIFHVIPADVGRPLTDLAAISKDDHLPADARAVLESSNAIEREVSGQDGLWLMRRILPYRTESGQVEGIVITYVDITERKNTNTALRAAMKEADRATKAKSRFLASASHDLRQPLQSMALLHKLMARQKRSTEGMRLANLLDQTLNSMTAMLDSMLDVNRIESGIVRPRMRPVPIAPIIERLVDEFGPGCKAKGLTLRSVSCNAWVQTDPQLLEQMLRNLLSNALKYTLKGGILIGCRRRGVLLSIQVVDTGIGVADSEKSAIFDAYHQADGSMPLASSGLGLGLSIVQRLAQLLEHPITVRSTQGKGSTFIVSLRVVAADEASPKSQKTLEIKEKESATGAILLVENEDSLRDLLAEVLMNEGHKVIPMASVQDALTWAGENVEAPDLLLTDMDLHGGASGLTLAHDLPDVLGNKVPTIILTGDINTSTKERIAKSGHKQVIKPVLPEILLAHISDLMVKSRQEKARIARRADASNITIHVVDDDAIIRESMRRLFESEGWMVVTYGTAEEFVAAPRPEDGSCLLVDGVLPGISGIELVTLLRSEGSLIPAVMLTGYGDAETAVAALKAGVSDLIEKPASAADLLASVQAAIDTGQNVRIKAEMHKAAKNCFANLTERENEVLKHVLAGNPNKIIAFELGINQRTVENHRASVMRKTGATSLPELVKLSLAANAQVE